MENYLKEFNSHSEYETFKASTDFIRPNVSICNLEDDVHYNGHDYFEDYLTFKALEDGTFSFSKNNIDYSLNNGKTWTTLTAGTNTPTVTKGNKILWKSNMSGDSTEGPGIFSSTGKFEVMGNAMSLVDNDHFIGDTTEVDVCQFKSLFSGCTGLISAKNLSLPATGVSRESYYLMFEGCTSLTTAPVLPATTLNLRCYYGMFEGCTSLTTAPVLPATTLESDCYQHMFDGCRSLATAPALPATTLAGSCYSNMFNGCTSLVTAPELPATTLTNACYYYMFVGCTSLTTAPALPATTLASSCYYGMFSGCTSLTTAPELPAMTLANACYKSMFSGCTSLNSVTCLATDISARNCTNSWLYGVASSGTFKKAASMTSWTTDVDGIPNGWTVVDASA